MGGDDVIASPKPIGFENLVIRSFVLEIRFWRGSPNAAVTGPSFFEKFSKIVSSILL